MIRTVKGKGTTRVEFWADERGPGSGLEIQNLTMFFGGVRLPVGGIASVYTDEAQRNRGYARQCMEYALELQRSEGRLLSFLFGVPCFYEPFGYTVVMPWYGIYMPLRSWDRLPDEPQMRGPSRDDSSSLGALYESTVGLRIGPLARDPGNEVEPHKAVHWRTAAMMRILAGPGGNARGYVCHSPPGAEEFEVVEAGAEDDLARSQILAYLLQETVRRGKDQLSFALPPDDPFALYLRRYDARFVVHTKLSGGGMARILDFECLCKALEPVFQRRAGLLRADLVPERATLSTEVGEAVVGLEGSAPPARAESSLVMMTKMFFGYLSFAEARRSGIAHGLRTEVGEALFPSANPFIYLRDRF